MTALAGACRGGPPRDLTRTAMLCRSSRASTGYAMRWLFSYEHFVSMPIVVLPVASASSWCESEDEREDRWPRRPSGRMLAPSEIKAKRRRGA